jgi:hypothetical protein
VTKEELYQEYKQFCKVNELVAVSIEELGKILKRKYNFQSGREASGDRKNVWKGVRFADKKIGLLIKKKIVGYKKRQP